MLRFLLFLAVVGLIAGAAARLLVPGPDPMSVPATVLLGIVGSFVRSASTDELPDPAQAEPVDGRLDE